MSDKLPPVPDLFCVNIQRHPRDLGVSIVLQATCELIARREVLRLFPEFRHRLVLMEVSPARYVELDWESGRKIIVRREEEPEPAFCVADTKPKRNRLPRHGREGRRGITPVWERLYIGGLPDAERILDDNPHGITTVITLSDVAVEVKRWDVNYLHFPTEDTLHLSVRTFDAIMDAIGENIRWGRVLLHCKDGTSRAPAIAAAWMHVVGFKGIDAALDEIRRNCPDIRSSEFLVETLRRHLK